jgi:DNA-binding GntR family transcriptional regulator
VYDSLTKAIGTGEIHPGERLSEQGLAEWLQVSRTPIREALAALASDGLIEVIPHKGAVVKTMHPDDIKEEYIVRAALESLAVELGVAQVPADVLDELDRLTDEMHELLRQDDVHGFLDRNRELHLRLYSFCGSARLLSLIESAWDKENFMRRFYYTLDHGPEEEEDMHHELLARYRRRDAAGARDLVKDSLLRTGAALAEQLRGRQQAADPHDQPNK